MADDQNPHIQKARNFRNASIVATFLALASGGGAVNTAANHPVVSEYLTGIFAASLLGGILTARMASSHAARSRHLRL